MCIRDSSYGSQHLGVTVPRAVPEAVSPRVVMALMPVVMVLMMIMININFPFLAGEIIVPGLIA